MKLFNFIKTRKISYFVLLAVLLVNFLMTIQSTNIEKNYSLRKTNVHSNSLMSNLKHPRECINDFSGAPIKIGKKPKPSEYPKIEFNWNHPFECFFQLNINFYECYLPNKHKNNLDRLPVTYHDEHKNKFEYGFEKTYKNQSNMFE